MKKSELRWMFRKLENSIIELLKETQKLSIQIEFLLEEVDKPKKEANHNNIPLPPTYPDPTPYKYSLHNPERPRWRKHY